MGLDEKAGLPITDSLRQPTCGSGQHRPLEGVGDRGDGTLCGRLVGENNQVCRREVETYLLVRNEPIDDPDIRCKAQVADQFQAVVLPLIELSDNEKGAIYFLEDEGHRFE
jgi:hypothetical protein